MGDRGGGANNASMADTAETSNDTRRAASEKFGQGFLRDIWQFADLGSELKPGDLRRYEILGEPVLIGRTRKTREVYAMRDICPHRAAPLSAGRLVEEPGGTEAVECPYHG